MAWLSFVEFVVEEYDQMGAEAEGFLYQLILWWRREMFMC